MQPFFQDFFSRTKRFYSVLFYSIRCLILFLIWFPVLWWGHFSWLLFVKKSYVDLEYFNSRKKSPTEELNNTVCVFALRWSRRSRRWCRSLQTRRTTRVPRSRTCPCSLRTSTVWDAPAPTPATRTVSTAQCSMGRRVSFTARHRRTQSGCCYVFSTTLLHSSAFSHSAAVCKLPRLFNEV